MVRITHGHCPKLEDLLNVINGETVHVDNSVYVRLEKAREAYLYEARKGKQIYGYCTGLGALFDKNKGTCKPEYEDIVLKEHAVGTGEAAPASIVRGFLFVRLTQLSQGNAPVRGLVARRIEEALNNDIIPVIPVVGSVGASGDLVPSAHAFLCIHRGVGQAYYGGRVVPCSKALEESGLDEVILEPGEALALINNTAWSTSLAGLGALGILDLLTYSIKVLKKTLRITGCNPEHYSEALVTAKKGDYNRVFLELLGDVECDPKRLQDPYSIRCNPQIYSSLLEVANHARKLVEEEMCSSTENPLIIDGKVLHGCAFHSIKAGIASDTMLIVLANLANLVERRIANLLSGKITGLPEFLATPESSVGAMIAHYVAAAITAEVRRASTPSTINSIPTSGSQEDINPMSPDAGLKLLNAVRRVRDLVAIEEAVVEAATRINELSNHSMLLEIIRRRQEEVRKYVAPFLS
ncbi:MAG: aromatic amino acid ammonia-lyase [Desulfurococcales archaeon]|nr:aromatic amino acid ammonia-lyase [Desulfurococcales archaeon]